MIWSLIIAAMCGVTIGVLAQAFADVRRSRRSTAEARRAMARLEALDGRVRAVTAKRPQEDR
ncbi:hypothetical protein [Streptomyces sp. NPDC020983]|uniref:hypothetical protein n=1 Tax=Streptomyces sp. NPDC020983 TaxID=3365106 RepID=UPI00378B56CB